MPEYKTNDNGIWKMKMHETILLEDGTKIRRVHNGWIYTEFHWDTRTGSKAPFQAVSTFVSN